MRINTFLRLLLLNIACLLTLDIHAQPAGAHEDHFLYQIKPGETLSSLSETFTSKQSNWKAIQKSNRIANTRKVPIGMTFKIPFSLIDEEPDQAKVLYLTGNVLVNNQPIDKNRVIAEADTIITGTQSNITLVLSDESKAQIPPDSTVLVKRLRKFRGTGLIDSIFNIETGKLAAHASPKKTGVGRFEIRTPVISEKNQATIFNSFFRVSGPDSQVNGVGLGLSFVKTVITRHNGQIQVESEPGHGTTFIINLPPDEYEESV